MIFTEQNRNNSFDETRSFTVAGNKENVRPVRPTSAPNPQRRTVAQRTPAQNGQTQRSNVVNREQRPAVSANGQAVKKAPGTTNQTARQSQSQATRPAMSAAPRPAPQPKQTKPTNSAEHHAHRNPNEVRTPRAVANPQAAELRAPVNHGPSDNAQSTKPISTDVRKQMMRQKNTQLEAKRRNTVYIDEEDEGSGEGGNTVMSLVKAMVYIAFVCVVSVFLAVTVIFVGNDVFAFVKSDKVVEITFSENPTLDDVAEVLHENGVIEYPTVFKLYAKFKKDNQKYIAGTYSVSPMMNYSFLLAEFKEKIDYGTIRITIPEGYTTDEIIDLFVSNGIGTREGFVDVIQNGEFDYWFIEDLEKYGISEDRIYRLDGYLFPDTYDFYKSSSEKTVINKLLRRFGQIFTKKYRDQCTAMGYTVDEMITLASIIEKEAANSSEFFKISSVFHNRLNNPWTFPKLESDATVVYVIEHETGERNVDLTYDTPYNTYKYEGLTPGPIANPSASAMLAALTPQETNYYFFYAYGGTSYFSETKAEHDAIIQQFKDKAAAQASQNNPGA